MLFAFRCIMCSLQVVGLRLFWCFSLPVCVDAGWNVAGWFGMFVAGLDSGWFGWFGRLVWVVSVVSCGWWLLLLVVYFIECLFGLWVCLGGICAGVLLFLGFWF